MALVHEVAGLRRVELKLPARGAIDHTAQARERRVLHGRRVHVIVIARMRLEDVRGRRRTDAGPPALREIEGWFGFGLSRDHVETPQLRATDEVYIELCGLTRAEVPALAAAEAVGARRGEQRTPILHGVGDLVV